MAGPRVQVSINNKRAGKALLDIGTAVNAPAGLLMVGINPNRKYYTYTSSPGKKSKRRKPVRLVQVAAWNEFGVPGKIPERPAIQSALTSNGDKYLRSLRVRLGLVMSKRRPSKTSIETTMLRLGALIVADIRASILAWDDPPNRKETVDRKGFNDPLVDTRGKGVGRLANSFEAIWIPGRAAGLAALRQAAKETDAFKGKWGR